MSMKVRRITFSLAGSPRKGLMCWTDDAGDTLPIGRPRYLGLVPSLWEEHYHYHYLVTRPDGSQEHWVTTEGVPGAMPRVPWDAPRGAPSWDDEDEDLDLYFDGARAEEEEKKEDSRPWFTGQAP